jgi:hypothetical protein
VILEHPAHLVIKDHRVLSGTKVLKVLPEKVEHKVLQVLKAQQVQKVLKEIKELQEQVDHQVQ